MSRLLPSALLCLLAAVPAAAQTLVYQCPCVDSVSIDRSANNRKFTDNRIRAYNGSGTNPLKLHGVMKFDVSAVPDTAKIFCVRLVTTNEVAYGSPKNNPVVDVYYSADDSWTRNTATGTSAKPGATVATHIIGLSVVKHYWHLDLAAHSFQADLKDDRVTVALSNVNPAYSYFYIYGHTGSPTGPAPYLEVSILAGPFQHQTVGTGCADAGNTKVSMTCNQGVVHLGYPVPLNVRTSPGLALTALITMGRGTASWGGLPLPFPLTPFGATGCFVNASAQVNFPLLTMPPGGAAFEPVVPKDPVLAGARVFFQAFILDPKANALGLVTTNAMGVTLWR